jgi:hypothetical protein
MGAFASHRLEVVYRYSLLIIWASILFQYEQIKGHDRGLNNLSCPIVFLKSLLRSKVFHRLL